MLSVPWITPRLDGVRCGEPSGHLREFVEYAQVAEKE